MDPASIVGLIMTGAKVSLVLFNFTEKVIDAPKEISNVCNELSAVNSALTHLQSWLSGSNGRLPSENIQRSMEDIIASCRQTYDDLEKEVQVLQPNLWNRLIWIKHEKDVLQLLRRIESHKASLNLILTMLSERTNARNEERLNKLTNLVGYVAKNQQKLSRKQRATEKSNIHGPSESSNSKQESTVLVVQHASLGLSPAEVDSSALPLSERNGLLAQQVGVSEPLRAIHPFAAESMVNDVRRDSMSSEMTSYTFASTISGFSDMSITDIDVNQILRPQSESPTFEWSLIPGNEAPAQTAQTTMLVSGEQSSSTTEFVDFGAAPPRIDDVGIKPSGKVAVPQKPARKFITLWDVLSRRTRDPYSLFDFYIYMRDVIRSVDYLDFWLDVSQHMSLCRHYVRELRRSVLVEIEEQDSDGISRPIDAQNSADDSKLSTSTVTRQDLRASAEKILYTYILPGAEREIAIPQDMVNRMMDAIEQEGRDDPEVFDPAKDYVFMAMDKDAFPGFIRRRRAIWKGIRRPGVLGNVMSGRYKIETIEEASTSSEISSQDMTGSDNSESASLFRPDRPASRLSRMPPEDLFAAITDGSPAGII